MRYEVRITRPARRRRILRDVPERVIVYGEGESHKVGVMLLKQAPFAFGEVVTLVDTREPEHRQVLGLKRGRTTRVG